MTKNIYFFKKVFKRGTFITRGVQNQTNSNQNRKKPQKTAFSLDVFRSFSYSTAWFGSVCGFYFTNQTKPNQTAT